MFNMCEVCTCGDHFLDGSSKAVRVILQKTPGSKVESLWQSHYGRVNYSCATSRLPNVIYSVYGGWVIARMGE